MMNGNRHDLTDTDYTVFERGEYGTIPGGAWFCRLPSEAVLFANLGKHEVVEHADGTITVSPSILVTKWDGTSWHGFLERGVWRDA